MNNIKSNEGIQLIVNSIKTFNDINLFSQYLFENINLLKIKQVTDDDVIEKYFYKNYFNLLKHLLEIDNKNSDILNNLGNLYFNGFGVKQDFYEAKNITINLQI